jgi:hypothetical protein
MSYVSAIIPRLIAFGDSYTQGIGLPDAYPLSPSIYDFSGSEYAWPTLLATKLNYKILNLANGGSGNLEILWKILSTDFHDDDLVIVMWSHFTRINQFKFVNTDNVYRELELYADHKRKKTLADISGYRVPKLFGYKVTDNDLDYDMATKNHLLMSHGSLYLKNKGLRSYHLLATTEHIFPIHPKIKIENFLNIIPNDWHRDKALDDQHPGIESQKLLASLIYDKIVQHELR